MSGGTFVVLVLLGATACYLAYAVSGRAALGGPATFLTLLAWIALSVGLVIRGTRAGHWPLTDRFAFALVSAWTILAFYLLFERVTTLRMAGAFVLPQALLLTLWAARRPAAEQWIRPLPPALQSGWFPLHVTCTAVAYAAFAIAGGLGTMFLLGEWLYEHRAPQETRFPPPKRTAYWIWRVVGLGFPWLTLGMLTGAIWAQAAWGRYWGWDPKESWTLITWLTYLILLHGHGLRGWRGRRTAWLAVLGVGVVLFTFLGVGWLVQILRLESVHIF